jgi:hypothetical protein
MLAVDHDAVLRRIRIDAEREGAAVRQLTQRVTRLVVRDYEPDGGEQRDEGDVGNRPADRCRRVFGRRDQTTDHQGGKQYDTKTEERL